MGRELGAALEHGVHVPRRRRVERNCHLRHVLRHRLAAGDAARVPVSESEQLPDDVRAPRAARASVDVLDDLLLRRVAVRCGEREALLEELLQPRAVDVGQHHPLVVWSAVELDLGALVGSGVGVEAAEDALRRVHGPLDESRPGHNEPPGGAPLGRKQPRSADGARRVGVGVDVPSTQVGPKRNRLLEARARELARRAAAVQRHGGARTRLKHVRRLEAVAASRREQVNPAAAREQFSLVGVGR
mmetsp:Transcript_4649/g.15564  ORF Transcript_4649/g.15564 Transcript_4649/m.15564 type:complete len:245 (+) Transcript_4649:722-1456(+)